MATKKLTKKQQMFAKEYPVDLNATQAAIRAGYSKKTAGQIGEENLRKPEISSLIQLEMDARSESTKIDAEYVLNTIKDTIDRCRQAVPVIDKAGEPVYTTTPDGDIVPAYKFDAGAVLKGCELLGRHLVLFKDKVEHTGKIEHEHTTSESVDFNAIREKATENARGLH